MRTGKGTVIEVRSIHGLRHARIQCAAELIPAPGQYLIAAPASSMDPLPVPLFNTESTRGGFTASAPIPEDWQPGLELFLRGPIGHGFSPILRAERVALIASDSHPSRLNGMMNELLKNGASIVLVTDLADDSSFPDEVEVQPMVAMQEALSWADQLLIDAGRDNLEALKNELRKMEPMRAVMEAQVLVRTSMPCGGIADCGVCAVKTRSGWKMACKDGPVFKLGEL